MKILKAVFILIVVSGALFLSACNSSPTTPPVTTTGSIRITSVPTGARVFLDNVDKGVTTDCTLTKVATGNRAIKLVMAGYTDYVGSATVTAGQTAAVNATLTATPPAGALSVTPAGGLTSTGPTGGPFTPASMDFSLQNTGGAAIDWTVSANQTWITVLPASGNLAAAASATVTISINAGANTLLAGAHNATVTFTNTTNATGNATRPVTLTISAAPGALAVTPAGGLSSTGPAGGPFTPSSLAYTFQNTGGTAIAWTASANQTWVTVSPTSGNLAAAAMTTVTVSINSVNANALGIGTYNALLTFTNSTNGTGNTTRPAILTVTDSSQPVSVTVDYTRVLPMPNPSGLDFPTLAWSFAPNNQGTSAMGKLADDNFTSTFVSLRTETLITIWVIDNKMHNGVTAVVCRTIKINGQTLNVGTTIYGQATFTLGNDGIVR